MLDLATDHHGQLALVVDLGAHAKMRDLVERPHEAVAELGDTTGTVGGHAALLGRTGAREAAAAMTVFGEPVDGARAAALGLAWAAVDDESVEDHALGLATRAGADPELARRTTWSLRTVLGPPPIPWPAALELERSGQMWSMRRKDLAADVRAGHLEATSGCSLSVLVLSVKSLVAVGRGGGG